ncbi:MAG TPA: ATP-binding protein [Polyangiaceae bacterium]|nr:ATP-binding protein [Polyangiaceae bacterium]
MWNPESTTDSMGFRVETERLHALVANIGLGVLVEDETRRLALVNRAFCEMFKLPVDPHQMIGTDCREAALQVAPSLQDPEGFLEGVTTRIRARTLGIGDEVLFKDGRVLERDYVPIAVDSVVRGHMWLFRDVTESRYHAQLERAAAVRDELRLAIDTIPGLVWSARPDGQVELFNQRWREYTGLKLEAGTNWGWEEIISPDDLQSLQTRFSLGVEAASEAEAEARLRRYDGQYRWFLLRAVPLLGSDGRPIRWYGQAIDIDDRKRSEEALHHAQTELSHVSRVTTLGELAASIAHEINQPISAMVADASACLNRLNAAKPDIDKIRESLAAIVSDGARAGDVLTRIRSLLARSSVGHHPCEMDEVALSAISLARPQLARHAVMIELSLDSAGVPIMGDMVELQQVLLNLLLNACEAVREVASDRRRVLVQTRLARETDGTWLETLVRDFGVGIDESKQDLLFSAFYTTKRGGLGMGLSISRSIIERHRGRIWASRNFDQGSTIGFRLPTQPCA